MYHTVSTLSHSLIMSSSKRMKQTKVMEIVVPDEILTRMEEEGGEVTPNIDDGQHIGYKLMIPIDTKHNLGFTGKAIWHFDKDDICEHKEVVVNCPSWDAKMIAEGMVDGQLVRFKWRKPTEAVEERIAIFGDCLVMKSWYWMGNDTFQDSLKKELDLSITKLKPTEQELPTNSGWNNGFAALPISDELFEDNVNFLMNQLLAYAQSKGYLQYKTPGMLEPKNAELEPGCGVCGCHPCCWTANKVNIVHDNKIILKNATNKQRRFYTYKQMTWLLHGVLGRGERRELPSCTLNGVRSTFPDAKGQYTGFKDTDSDGSSSS